MPRITIESNSLKKMKRKIENLADCGIIDAREIKKIHRAVLKEYVKTAKRNIQPMDIPETTIRGNKIARGQLRRSVGVWVPKKQSPGRTRLMAGPRSGDPKLKRVPRYSRRDGWFAHMVEMGVAGDSRTTGRNVGVFDKSLRQSRTAMEQKQLSEYRKRFGKFVRKT